jgi:superfamily II DNA or RNA helicase
LIYIEKLNETYIKVTSPEPSIEQELWETLSFEVPGAIFMPAYRHGNYDGMIRLYRKTDKLLYLGLLYKVLEYAKKRGYDVEYNYTDFSSDDFSVKEAKDFVKTLNLPDRINVYDYQWKTFITAIRDKKHVYLSSTGSGKSLMIYLIARYLNLKTLIIAPRENLVRQLSQEFIDFGYKESMHQIYSGQNKDTDDTFTFSTWQSIKNQEEEWLDQFECVIVDEVHNADGPCLRNILEKMKNCVYRFGFTGTLRSKETNQLIVEGLLGKVLRVSETKELIERNILTPLMIKIIILHYPKEEKKKVKGLNYQGELDFLIDNEFRNEFLTKLLLSLDGNNVTMCQRLRHADELQIQLTEQSSNPVYIINGNVKGEVREDIRYKIEDQENSNIIAIARTFSEGVNIKRLNNLIYAHPTKDAVEIEQSIGRLLRTHESKDKVYLYDIADNLIYNGKDNYTVRWLKERIKLYKKRNFPFKIYNVKLKYR